jgi:L-alanine-DL-glutamate epimerase-like enolase superfamily enzyme
MKIGRHPEQDVARVRAAREAIGADVGLYVDANGAYSRKRALLMAERFTEFDVSWFEEPVTSDDLGGLHLIRDRAPAGMDIAAGEYGYDLAYFKHMLDSQAVDVQQADATRCAGISEFLRVGALCDAANMPMSAHTSPSLHLHPCCALPRLRNIEYFHDHVRIENMFFDGVIQPVGGRLHPDLSRPGMGLEFKKADAEKYAV